MFNLDDWLTRQDVLNYFKISKSTYRRWQTKAILKGIKKGNTTLYHISEIKHIVAGFKTDENTT